MARSTRWRVVIGAALLVAAAAAAPARAQQAAPAPAPQPLPAPVVLVVDLQQVVHDTKAAKDAQAVINQQYSVYAKEVAQQEDDLQKGRAELDRQRTALTPDAYNTRARELQQRYDELSKIVQSRRQGLQQSYNEAMTKVENVALEVIADIVKERRANLVMAKQALVFEAEGMDITAETLTRLDQKLPSVQVNLPKAEGEGTAAPKPTPPAKK